MTEKKYDQTHAESVPLALISPPSHPTTLGNVWIGETRPAAADFAAALKAEAATWTGSDQSRNR